MEVTGKNLVVSPWFVKFGRFTPPKTNMTMENPSFEDVFPIENQDFPVI